MHQKQFTKNLITLKHTLTYINYICIIIYVHINAVNLVSNG